MQTIKDIAVIAQQQLRAGQPARVIATDKQTAFGWSSGTLAGLTSVVESAVTSQMTFPATRVAATANPPAVTAASAVKPIAFTLDAETIALKKHSGRCVATFETMIDSANLVNAISQSLVHGAALSWENDLVATVVADTAITKVTKAPNAAAILEAQAALLQSGNTPEILALSPADYATILGAAGTAGVLTVVNNPQEAVQTLFGSQIVVSAGLATGSALLLSRDAVLAVEHDASPAVLVDPYSGSSKNEITVIADVVAGCIVARPSAVVLIKASA